MKATYINPKTHNESENREVGWNGDFTVRSLSYFTYTYTYIIFILAADRKELNAKALAPEANRGREFTCVSFLLPSHTHLLNFHFFFLLKKITSFWRRVHLAHRLLIQSDCFDFFLSSIFSLRVANVGL